MQYGYVRRLRQKPKGQPRGQSNHGGVSKRAGRGALREMSNRTGSFSKTEEKGTCDEFAGRD